MATYTACLGTGRHGTDARRISGATGKYFHLNGKTYAKCVECGKSVRVPSMHAPFAPAHKAAA